MSEAKHTPGPWQRHGSHIYTADPERAILAQVFNPGKRPGDYPLTENANLIAAAPELLGALEDCCVIAKPGNPASCCPVYRPGEHGGCSENEDGECHIWKAIQKARGLQQ